MPIRPNIPIQPSARTSRPVPKKQILRAPCYQGDNPHVFPDTQQIYARRDVSNIYGFLLNDFFVAVSNALDRVFIVDNYFFKPYEGEKLDDRLEILKLSIDSRSFQASEVKIISGCGADSSEQDLQKKLQSHAEQLNQQRQQRRNYRTLSIEYKRMPDRLIHDRFAIIDDELWHFGGTVGGFEKQFSVASRGWNASEYKADALFHNIWQLSKGNLV